MRHLLISFLLISSLFTVSCGPKGKRNTKGTAAKIELLFPLFESYQLGAFRNEDWCKAIEYRRGRYATSSGKNCIGILTGNRREFDQAARRDLVVINSGIRKTHGPLRVVTAVRYSDKGKLTYGVFDCREGQDGLVYVFSLAPLGDEPSFEGTPLNAIGANWWTGG